jgi:hypothetical protein
MDSIKYFGLVIATLNRTRMKAKLEYTPRGRKPLSDGHRQRCVDWAAAWAKQEGYEVDTSEVEA